jgi:cysteinyl-tRNA synthetase
VDKTQLQAEIELLYKARNQLIEKGIYEKADEIAKSLYAERNQLDEAGFERMVRTLANDIIFATKELR